MDKSQALSSIKKVHNEATKINTSAVIDFFEIDTRQIEFDLALIDQIPDASLSETKGLFRFHNSISLTTRDIYFNNLKYSAAPISVEGFEMTTQGTLPRPTISLSVDFNGEQLLARLKVLLETIGDLTGAKFTRIRTFAKFIDNDISNGGGNAIQLIDRIPNHDADPNAVLARDLYFIDRKSNETNRTLEFELASSLDLESATVPKRLVIQDRCQWQYRGAGCCYSNVLNKDTHGLVNSDEGVSAFKNTFKTPRQARPVATASDEPIFSASIAANDGVLGSDVYVDRDVWAKDTDYTVGDSTFLIKNGVEYHFVCRDDHRSSQQNSPPNLNYWFADQCSKSVKGCRLRFNGTLPYGGFPAVNKVAR